MSVLLLATSTVCKPVAHVFSAGTNLANIRIRVGETKPPGGPTADGGDWNAFYGSNGLCQDLLGILPAGPTSLACKSPLVGRYVSVHLLPPHEGRVLQLCEVQVYGSSGGACHWIP